MSDRARAGALAHVDGAPKARGDQLRSLRARSPTPKSAEDRVHARHTLAIIASAYPARTPVASGGMGDRGLPGSRARDRKPRSSEHGEEAARRTKCDAAARARLAGGAWDDGQATGATPRRQAPCASDRCSPGSLGWGPGTTIVARRPGSGQGRASMVRWPDGPLDRPRSRTAQVVRPRRRLPRGDLQAGAADRRAEQQGHQGQCGRGPGRRQV
jgi:hypothetical protein